MTLNLVMTADARYFCCSCLTDNDYQQEPSQSSSEFIVFLHVVWTPTKSYYGNVVA